MTKTDIQPRRSSLSGGDLALFRVLLPVALGVRLIYGAVVELVPDESYYWVWSRHLRAGYFDHPPMIAYVIWAGTHLLGSRELGVRLVVILMSIAAMAIIVALARRVLCDVRATVWVAAIWITSPLIMVLGTITTPDTPAIFFSVCALACIILIVDRDDRAPDGVFVPNHGLWMLFGLFSGLALLSKYTAVLLPGAVALAMLFSRKGLAHYRRPWIYLSGILAVIVFSPVIWWNANHQWASFLFQIHHGTVGSAAAAPGGSVLLAALRPLKDLGVFLIGQAFVWTPVLFGIALIVLVRNWRRYRLLSQVDRVLLWCGTLPLLVFAFAATQSHHTEPNWPGFAYFPISLLTARWLSENWKGRRLNWAHAGVRVGLVGLIALHIIAMPAVSRAIVRVPFHIPHALRDLTGWPEYGKALAEQSASLGPPLICNRHQDAGEASFYMPGQPEVWCIGIGSRPTGFDYFDEPLDFAKMPRVLWLGDHSDLFCKQYGYVEQQRTTFTFSFGRNARTVATYLLTRPQR